MEKRLGKITSVKFGLGGHDAINRWICVKARAKHLGIYGHCEHCEEGVVYGINSCF